MMKRRGLGSLLSDSQAITKNISNFKGVALLKIKEITENPNQPRKEFEQEKLDELASSIAIHGIIQPITVRRISNSSFELISGERRFRAAKQCGLKELPAYIREVSDQSSLEMAIIENVQRENLNAIEVALSFEQMITECGIKQKELGDRVGKNRSTVTNYLRLLQLPVEVQTAIIGGQLSMGQAKPLIGVADKEIQLELLEKILENGLSARVIETLVKNQNDFERKATPLDHYKEEMRIEELTLKGKTKVPVKIQIKDLNEGAVAIKFKDQEELASIIDKLLA